ncbi:MAG TPA: hypothetical protein VIQ77_08340 [Mucilaginibacter sp.]|jgi:hypothetical protein
MRRNIILLFTLPLLIPGQVMGQPVAAGQTDDSSTGLIVVLVFGLVILVLLTLWLFKNSSRLAETEQNQETNGKIWLESHLKDLDDHQLDILIKRHPLMNNPSLDDAKPNQ